MHKHVIHVYYVEWCETTAAVHLCQMQLQWCQGATAAEPIEAGEELLIEAD